MLWNEYWEKIKQMIDDDECCQDFNDPESLVRLMPVFKKKWKKNISAEDAYYDIFGLI